MCRHLAYLGSPIPLAELLTDPAHGLLTQSYAPRDMRSTAQTNADGFGVAWYGSSPHAPVRYRRACPMWTDTNIAELARVTTTQGALASVRSATPGMPLSESACAPFRSSRWLFSHNGFIPGWPHAVTEQAARLPLSELLAMEALTDSALLWALVRRALHAGQAPELILPAIVREVAEAAPGARLNLLLTDGVTIYATTWGHSLSARCAGGAIVVASEPLDESSDWFSLDDGQLLVADTDGVQAEPI